MESKANYTIVGVTVLVLIAGMLASLLWLSVGFGQKIYSTYIVYLHEAASGLSENSPVKFNGVQVGYVKAIKLNRNDPRQVEVWLNIQQGTPITNSTSATLLSQGITGVTYMGLSASSSELTPLKRLPGEPYPVIPSKPSFFNQLDSMAKEVSDNLNKITSQAELVFNEKNSKNFSESLKNLERFSQVLAQNSKNIDNFLKNSSQASNDLPQILNELQKGVKKFSSLASDMSKAGNSVTQVMDSGKTAIDKITQQTLPPATQLLNRLNAIAANLEKVSNEMRVNPSVVIRGSTPPKPGPGE